MQRRCCVRPPCQAGPAQVRHRTACCSRLLPSTSICNGAFVFLLPYPPACRTAHKEEDEGIWVGKVFKKRKVKVRQLKSGNKSTQTRLDGTGSVVSARGRELNPKRGPRVKKITPMPGNEDEDEDLRSAGGQSGSRRTSAFDPEEAAGGPSGGPRVVRAGKGRRIAPAPQAGVYDNPVFGSSEFIDEDEEGGSLAPPQSRRSPRRGIVCLRRLLMLMPMTRGPMLAAGSRLKSPSPLRWVRRADRVAARSVMRRRCGSS